MPQYLLEREDIAAIHHEVTGKGVPESMASLPLRKLNRGAIQGAAKGCNAGRERAMHSPVCTRPVSQLWWNRHVPYLPRLGSGIGHDVALESVCGKLFSLGPSSTSSQAEQRHQFGMRVVATTADRVEKLADLLGSQP